MVNVVERLEIQRSGGGVFRDTKYSFKDLYGFSGMQSIVCGSPLFACKFSPFQQYINFVALSNEDGKVEIRDTSKKCPGTVIQGHMNAIFDLCWTSQTPNLITASGDYTARLWDVKAGMTMIKEFAGHTGSIKSVCCHPSTDDLFASGSRDGTVMLWDHRVKSNVLLLVSFNFIQTCKSVTSIAYLNDNYIISSTANDSCLKIWDTRRCYSALKKLPIPAFTITPATKKFSGGYSCVTVDAAQLYIHANAYVDNTIYSFAVANYDFIPCGQYTGHKINSFYIKHSVSRDGKLLASGSGDQKAYIWDVKKPGSPIAALVGHSGEVSAVDWSQNGLTELVSCSDDTSYMLWKLYPHEKCDKNVMISQEISGFAEDIVLSCQNDVAKYISGKPKTLCHISCKSVLGNRTQVHQSPVKVRPDMKSPPGKKLKLSPMKSPMKAILQSPTANLPNYIVDGTSPHQHECRRSPRQHPDWLTRLRESRTPQRSGKSPSAMSPRERLARRRNSASKSASVHEFFTTPFSRSKPRSLNFSSLPANSNNI